MSWKKLLAEKRVAREPTSKKEIDELRQMVAVNLHDAQVAGISAQGRYEFAYNASRLLATIAVRASGYRVTAKGGHHYFTFQALQTSDRSFVKVAIYFDDARDKRNEFSYDAPVLITDTDADDLLKTVEQFQRDAETWIRAKFPKLT
jgi:hypothetical protein